jgi:hypothetical protein
MLNRTLSLVAIALAVVVAGTAAFYLRDIRRAAATIPDARLTSFDRGGHLVMAVEQTSVRRAIAEHILAHTKQ